MNFVYNTEVLELKVQFCAVEKIGYSSRREKKGSEENKKRQAKYFFYTLTFNIVTNFVYHQIFEINKYAIL